MLQLNTYNSKWSCDNELRLCNVFLSSVTSMDSSPNAQENSNSPYVNAVLRWNVFPDAYKLTFFCPRVYFASHASVTNLPRLCSFVAFINAKKWLIFIFCFVLRITGLIHKRHRSPWLWNDVLYSWTPPGREHDECLQIIHGFTNKVIENPTHFTVVLPFLSLIAVFFSCLALLFFPSYWCYLPPLLFLIFYSFPRHLTWILWLHPLV